MIEEISIYDEKSVPLTVVSETHSLAQEDIQQVLSAAQRAPGQTTFQLAFSDKASGMFLMALSDLATGRTAVGMISHQGSDQPGLLEHANRTPRREVYLIDPDGQVIYHQG